MSVLRKITTLQILGLLTFVAFQNPCTLADSVYAIPDHWGPLQATLNVYDILEGYDVGKINYRATYQLEFGGAGDVTIDIQSDILFITFEFQDQIQLVNARTFLSEGLVTAEGLDIDTPGLAGIVLDYADPNTVRLYTIERGTDHLFVYEWDASMKSLTPITPDPNDATNPNYGEDVPYFLLEPGDPNSGSGTSVFACGLAIDEENGLLYISQYSGTYSSVIEVYNIENFESNYFPNVRTINLNDAFDGDNNYAVDIDIDIENQWLYAGGYTGHGNLIRYDLDRSDPDASDFGDGIKEVVSGMGDLGVIGLAVDGQYVYMTTYNYLLEAWDTNVPFGLGWSIIDAETTDAGAGVCVADVDYVPPFSVSKVADVDDVGGCITPRAGEEITYTISYGYNWTEAGDPNLYDFTQIRIEDYLPGEVDFLYADPNAGYYDAATHSYLWFITPENYGSPNSIDITVEINDKVTPGEAIENAVVEIVSAIAGQEYKQTAEVQTTICGCGDNGKVIYVDGDATQGDDDGTSWADAYVDLQSALRDAFPCDQIWVAEGTYLPESEPNELASFELVNGVGVYGGFDGTETEVYERNWAENETVLSGYIDPNEVYFVVRARGWVDWAILDGFTIERGSLAGVYCEGGSVLLEHNCITDNGIGVYCNETLSPVIRNSFIYDNAMGMAFEDCGGAATVRNNTIVDNSVVGIEAFSGVEPSIKNCIFRGQGDPNDMIGCYATYSCIEYPNNYYADPNETVFLGIGEGNIDDSPLFETGTYFLSSGSPCIDAGDANEAYLRQRDIDKEFRVLYGRVDMGADEYYDCDYVSDADFNSDGIVNFPDYGEFAGHWLETVSDPNWNSVYDLAGENEAIDVNDLALFADEWLWMDCETMIDLPMDEQQSIDTTYESMMMSSVLSSSSLIATQAEPTLKEQVDTAQEVIGWLENLWKADKELRKNLDKKDWDAFMDKIYEWFDTLDALLEEGQV